MPRGVRLFEAPLGLIRNKVHLLIFINGFLLSLLVYFYTENSYEDQIFKAIATQVKQTTRSENQDSILVNALNLTYSLEKFRSFVFDNKQINTIKSDLIRPVSFDLMTGKGACGSYSYVLGRILAELNFEIRFAQMKVDGQCGGHILIETKTANGWAVLDPSYNLFFTRADGTFASFNDLKQNWDTYKNQVPADYNMKYNYSDVRYTNWNKIPIIMPALKAVFEFSLGEKEANEFSMRNLFLRKFDFLLKVTLGVYIFFTVILFVSYQRKVKENRQLGISLLFPKKSSAKIKAFSPNLMVS